MIELIGLVASGAAAVVGYTRSRDFVAGRLRFVDGIQKGYVPVVAGVAAAAVATPVAWIVPVIGGGTALLFGAAVAAGTRVGASRIRKALAPGL